MTLLTLVHTYAYMQIIYKIFNLISTILCYTTWSYHIHFLDRNNETNISNYAWNCCFWFLYWFVQKLILDWYWSFSPYLYMYISQIIIVYNICLWYSLIVCKQAYFSWHFSADFNLDKLDWWYKVSCLIQHMGQVTKVCLSCYLVLLSSHSKNR